MAESTVKIIPPVPPVPAVPAMPTAPSVPPVPPIPPVPPTLKPLPPEPKPLPSVNTNPPLLSRLWAHGKVLVFTALIAGASWTVATYKHHKTELVHQQALQDTTMAVQSQITVDTAKANVQLKADVAHAQALLNGDTVYKVRPFLLAVQHGDGSYEVRLGGNVSWRYNNPGKLMAGPFTQLCGAAGTDGSLAIFGTLDEGRTCLEKYIFQNAAYTGLTLEDALKKFGKGYPATYVFGILKASKLKGTTKLSDFTVDDHAALVDAIQEAEHFAVGTIKKYKDLAAYTKENS